MFSIEITGAAPGAKNLVHAYDDQHGAERVAHAIVNDLSRNKHRDCRQGSRVLDPQGRCL